MAAFTIFVSDTSDVPISGASVALFNASGTPIMSALSDVDGAALLATDHADVIIVVSKSGYSFKQRYYIEPAEGDVFDIEGTALTIAPPTDAGKCRVYGRILDPLSKVLSDRWKFTVNILGQMGSAQADDIITSYGKVGHEDGFVIMDLLRGASYALSPLPICNALVGEDDYDRLERVEFKVPDSETAKLIDLIAPRVKEVTLVANNFVVALGEEIQVDLEVTLTNEEIAETPAEYISILPADSEIVNASIEKTYIKIKGVERGQTTVTVLSSRARSTAESMFYRPYPETILNTITLEIQ